MRLYHGSPKALEPGVRLTPRGEAYEEDWSRTDFYAALEFWRPAGFLAHKEAVFACADPDDVDLAGGATEYMCEVDEARTTWHDVNAPRG